jgi:hypothetical protein
VHAGFLGGMSVGYNRAGEAVPILAARGLRLLASKERRVQARIGNITRVRAGDVV